MKSKTEASTLSRRLKPRETRSASSKKEKDMEAGLRVDVCGPLQMSYQMVSRGQGLPMSAGNLEDTRDWRSGVVGC